jgi:hypothetical protein
MVVNEGGRVTLFPRDSTTLWLSPGFGSRRLRAIPAGQTFMVEDGPVCLDSVNWWRIEGYAESGAWSGWVGEGQNSSYWIEPFETGPVECPGAPPPRLVPGERGRITLEPYLPNRVRSSPERQDDNIVGELKPGETFDVISGPVCDLDNGWRWWLVQNNAVAGWSAEGVIDEYWMEPLP